MRGWYHEEEVAARRSRMMRTITVATLALVLALAGSLAQAADDSRVKAATRQVESGAKKIGDGQVGKGVEETAKGVGSTVVEGAKYTGEKLKESGKAAEPQARSAWHSARDGAVAFGHSVKNFFTRLFSD
jgi:hypothetical protein